MNKGFPKEWRNVDIKQLIEEKDMRREPESPLQKWMFDRGIRQSWLAEKSGLKQPLISKIATNKTIPDINQARLILKALQQVTPHVTLDDLWPLPKEDE